jgi:hypothetical protein
MSALWRKADISDPLANVLLLTHSGRSCQRSLLLAGRCLRKLEPELGCLLANLCFGAPQEGGNVTDRAPVAILLRRENRSFLDHSLPVFRTG